MKLLPSAAEVNDLSGLKRFFFLPLDADLKVCSTRPSRTSPKPRFRAPKLHEHTRLSRVPVSRDSISPSDRLLRSPAVGHKLLAWIRLLLVVFRHPPAGIQSRRKCNRRVIAIR